MDALPGFCGASPNASACIPIAKKDINTYPGSDYYQIGLQDYSQQFHTNLPATKLRGYYDMNPAATDNTNHYLGPFIIAQRDVPVRIKFTNNLGTGTAGNLFIPVDTTYMGAGTGFGDDGVTACTYSENRATLHLHGGINPWISDGTPHQWITPAGEPVDTHCKKGASFQNVPDMVGDGKSVLNNTDKNDGVGTFYWPNQQSNRLQFYHDHAYGITRLNVYAGEAAGYLVTDSTEDALIASNVLPNQSDLGASYKYGIPLVIQEKTFVPDPTNLAAQDPTWNYGGTGSLWFPHVYMPNQNPADPLGVAAMGRWDYGPWFWPAMDPSSLVSEPVLVSAPGVYPPVWAPGTPNPSGTPESYMDTPIVNGRAYPYLNVAPKAYRFRVLSAANDRGLNLQLYQADPLALTEVRMVPSTPHNKTTTPPLCTTSTASVTPNSGLTVAVNTPSGLPAGGCWPDTWPADARIGGVPDPTLAGPAIIQIGTEGGFLPAPAVIPSTPVGFEYNRRNIVVLNIASHGLLLGPAERADIIVDFSQFGGKTIILYNDSPAPIPAFDPRNDFYTDDPDQSYATGDGTGGAPTTLAGFGPNTRTLMQFRVASGSNAPFDLAGLKAALPAAYAASQPPPIVPEKDGGYDAAFGTVTPVNTFSRIQDNSVVITPLGAAPIGTIVVMTGGSGYSAVNPPAVTITGASTTPANAIAVVSAAGKVTGITITNPGAGYTIAPFVTVAPPTSGTTSSVYAVLGTKLTMAPKAIQELFTLDYGRMNATLGVELPLTSFNIQTTIPYGYIDPATEILTDGEPQLWKITHNGVDTHFLHIHLFNVQVINRVGWDGQVRPPDANEMGWKETIRMSPLEDIIVAALPIAPKLPFAIPDSWRLLDVTRPLGATNAAAMPGFSNIDPNNQPTTVANNLTNFGWEYVWHCHLLGHEENDMMRPMVFTAKAQMISPVAGSTLPSSSSVTFTWGNGAGVSATFINVGTTPGGSDLFLGTSNTAKSVSATGLLAATATAPNIYVRLFSVINGVALYNDYVYKAGVPTAATLVSPASGSTLPGGSVLFTWNGFGAFNTSLYVGTTATGATSYNLAQQNRTGFPASYTVSNIPTTGVTLYVQVYSFLTTGTIIKNYTVTAPNALPSQLTAPAPPTTSAPGTILSSNPVTFTWDAGLGVTKNWLYIGTTGAGSNNLVGAAVTSPAPRTFTANNLPINGATLYVRLWSFFSTSPQQYVDYIYRASTQAPATIISPTNGTPLTRGSRVTFTWNIPAGVTNTWFYAGTTGVGSNNVAGVSGRTTFAVNVPAPLGLPTLYVRIWSFIGGSTQFVDYTYPIN